MVSFITLNALSILNFDVIRKYPEIKTKQLTAWGAMVENEEKDSIPLRPPMCPVTINNIHSMRSISRFICLCAFICYLLVRKDYKYM